MHEIQNSATKITNSFVNAQDQKLSAHAQTLITSIARYIDRSGASLEKKISESSADVISQFQATSTELVMLNRAQQKHFEKIASDHADMLHSLHQTQDRVLVGAEHLSFSNSRKKKRGFFDDASTGLSHCTCAINAAIGKLDLSSHSKLRLGTRNGYSVRPPRLLSSTIGAVRCGTVSGKKLCFDSIRELSGGLFLGH